MHRMEFHRPAEFIRCMQENMHEQIKECKLESDLAECRIEDDKLSTSHKHNPSAADIISEIKELEAQQKKLDLEVDQLAKKYCDTVQDLNNIGHKMHINKIDRDCVHSRLEKKIKELENIEDRG